MSDKNSYAHILRGAQIKSKENTFTHPWNTNSEITGTHLSSLSGLVRTGVSLVRIRPGKESFAYHMHHREEEWIYVVAGQGLAIIDDEEYELGPGDFVAFPTPSVPHQMTNPSTEDLVYLMGGEHKNYEIADFPTLDKRMIRRGTDIEVFTLSEGKPFPKSTS